MTEQREAVGHSVRAMYLYTGMADVASRTDAPGYREALDAIWSDVASSKLYLTGGIGARGSFESFGKRRIHPGGRGLRHPLLSPPGMVENPRL